MPYTMTVEENDVATAMRDAMNAAKAALVEAKTQMNLCQTKADAFMVLQKAAGRADSYTAAYAAKTAADELSNEIMATRSRVGRFHASVSMFLQTYFTAGAFVLAGPGR
jgi:hypothetical protein